MKNDSQEKPLLKPKIQHNDEEDTIDQNAIPDCIFYSHNQTIANEDSNGINIVSETNEVIFGLIFSLYMKKRSITFIILVYTYAYNREI